MAKELTKKDIDKAIEVKLDSKTVEDKIWKMIKDRLKNDKELEDRIVDIHKNVMTQFHKALWVKRGFWRNMLKNQAT